MATIGSMNTKMTADASGFTKTVHKAGETTEGFISKIHKAGVAVTGLGGFMNVGTRGFMILNGVLQGFGIGLAGALIPNVVKATRSMFGWSEAQEELREKVAATTEELKKQRDALLFGKGQAEEWQIAAEGSSTPQDTDERIRLRNEIATIQQDRMNKSKVDDIIDGIKDEIDKMTMSRQAIIDNQLAELKASDSTRRRVELLVKKAEALKAEKKAQEEATKAMLDDAKERGEQQRETRRQVEQALDKQKNDLKAAREKIKGMKLELPAGVEFGSSEAIKRLAEIATPDAKDAVLEEQADLLREAIRVLNDIRRELGAPEEDNVVDF